MPIVASAMLCAPLHAVTLAVPTFDTDSYIFMATSNAFAPQITLGESLQGTPGHPHFNFGVIEFDSSSLSSNGNKFLQLSSIEYVSGQPPSQVTSATGTASVQLVALGESFADFQASGDKTLWYDTYVQNAGVTVLGTFDFTDQSSGTVDVTSTVNMWIADGNSNQGFALFSTQGSVELGSMTHANVSLRPALVDTAIASVPEPSSLALLGLGSVSLLVRRRR